MAKLKKGSKAAKAWGARMKRLRNAGSNSTKLKKRKMAKRRKSTKKRRSYKRSSSILGFNTAKILAAGLYGAIRAKTSNMIAPYTSKIPLGNVSDEAGMLILTTIGKKYLFKRAGTMRDALTAGQTIELARIGEAVATGSLGINLFGGQAQAGTNGYVFA